MNVDKEALGMRISNIRKSKGLTLEAFGELIDDAGKSAVSKWEKGITIPNNKRLKKIAELGNITVDDLMFGSLESFIFYNLESLIPPEYKFIAGVIPMDSLRTLINKIKEQDVTLLEIEKIKKIIEQELSSIIVEMEKETDIMLNYISNNIENKEIASRYFSFSGLPIAHTDVQYIFDNAKHFTFKEKCLLSSKIEDLFTYLHGLAHEQVYMIESSAYLIKENDLLNIQKIDFNDETLELQPVTYKDTYKTLPHKHEQYGLLVTISNSDNCDFVKEGDCVHVIYYPQFEMKFLYEHFSNARMALLHDGKFYIGQIVDSKVFETYSKGEKVIFDLKNVELHSIFHLLSIFY